LTEITAATVSTWSMFRSAEFNGRTWYGGPITWLAGFRWIEWDDRMTVTSTNTGDVTDQFDATAGNNLYGAQLGADVAFWNAQSFIRVDGIAKGGVYYNRAAYQRTNGVSADPFGAVTPLGSAAAAADTVSFMGEVGVNASVAVTRWLSWRAGYSVFWLAGVATAPQQFAVSDISAGTGTIDTDGSVLLHGVTTGLEARW